MDLSNNPDNNNFVSDSSDSLSLESNGDYYTNHLSNEAISSLDSGNLAKSNGDDGSVSSTDSSSKSSKSTAKDTSSTDAKGTAKNTANSDAKNTATKNTTVSKTTASNNTKNATSISVSNKTVHSGDYLILTLKDKNGKALKGKKVVYKITGFSKTYTKTSDSNGRVKLMVTPVGSYKATFSFAGDSEYNATQLQTTIKIIKSSTSIEVKNTTVPKSTNLVVTLKNNITGRALANKKVSFKIPALGNKVYTKTTNANGQAKLQINQDKKFKIIISFAGDSNLNKTSHTATITPVKSGTTVSFFQKIQYGKKFVVVLKNIEKKAVAGRKVTVKISDLNKTITKKTNANGKFNFAINALGTFKVKVNFAGDSTYFNSSKTGNFTIIKGNTHINAPSTVGLGSKYIITIKNPDGKLLTNKRLLVTLNKKFYNKTTNSKGQLAFNLNLKKGSYSIKVVSPGTRYYNPSNISKTFKVVDPQISISKIIAAAKDLKTRANYINLLNKSYTVTIDKKTYTLDEFAYLMAGAITNLQKGSKASVTIKDLSNNYKSSGAKINGKLSKSEYVKLATNITKYVNSNKRIPNYKVTNIGKMEADLYIYSFTAILESYSKNKKLPSSVTVKSDYVRGGYSYSLSQGNKILNCREIFNAATFKKYLQTGGKCALNDAIKSKAKALTKGLTSPLAKAIAIFRFVRDDVTYSFYSNSLKGAAKTLSTRSGNCCDKANLIVAMCRSVGVYARYSHAQGCKFSSGLYAGHVWAQVYDTRTQTWYSADATSYRNEVGNIKNWNTNSHYRDNTYIQIPF